LEGLCKFASLFYKIATLSYEEALKYFGLPRGWEVDPDELKRLFRQKAFELHPDRNKSPTAQQEFIALQKAYELILDPSQESTPDYEGVEDVVGDMAWRHHYYTPLSKYDDLERWEFNTNPEIQKQYERDFQDEQEFAQEDYERKAEEAWELDRDASHDNVISIEEKLAGIDPDKLLDAIGAPLDQQLQMLGLSQQEIDIRRWMKKNNWLTKEISAACYRAILEHHPEHAEELILVMHTVRPDLSEYTRWSNDPVNIISVEDFIALFKQGVLQTYDFSRIKDESKRIQAFELIKEYLLQKMVEPDSNVINITDLSWRMPQETRDLYAQALKERAAGRKMTRIEEGILFALQRANRPR